MNKTNLIKKQIPKTHKACKELQFEYINLECKTVNRVYIFVSARQLFFAFMLILHINTKVWSPIEVNFTLYITAVCNGALTKAIWQIRTNQLKFTTHQA